MTKIDFGFDNSERPTGSFEGIGVGSNATGSIITGELLDVVKLNGVDYLITRVLSAFGNRPNDIGKIDVRRALVDLFPDGSSILFVDREHDVDCEKLEDLLNHEVIASSLNDGSRVLDVLRDQCSLPAQTPDRCYDSVGLHDGYALSIPHEVFERKQSAIKQSHGTFSSMAEELMELRAKLQELDGTKRM